MCSHCLKFWWRICSIRAHGSNRSSPTFHTLHSLALFPVLRPLHHHHLCSPACQSKFYIYISSCALLLNPKILAVMIHHWITLVIRMFFPLNFWLDTIENWIFSIKLYLMGRCFLNFLPKTLLVVFNVISLYMHAFFI
jgi:hypothetical protein